MHAPQLVQVQSSMQGQLSFGTSLQTPQELFTQVCVPKQFSVVVHDCVCPLLHTGQPSFGVSTQEPQALFTHVSVPAQFAVVVQLLVCPLVHIACP